MMKRVAKLNKLKKYTIMSRENRFVVIVKNGRESKRALLRNTGRLHDLIQHGFTALCLDRSQGKTDCEIIGVLVDNEKAALIDPYTQARAFEVAVNNKLIPWMNAWKIERREVTVSDCRLDYKITNGTHEGYMELKSAAYCDGYHAMYPDCPSERGLRHINTLKQLNADGYRSMIIFMAAHPYAKAFKPNAQAHEQLAFNLISAHEKGLEVYAVKVFLDIHGNIFLPDPDLPITLYPPSNFDRNTPTIKFI
jgi:sugar fermentation stimulation protein A